MSGGISCHCPELRRPVIDRNWGVIQRHGNASAFNGYKWQWSRYSCVKCFSCGMVWRTNAAYVAHLHNLIFVDGDWKRPVRGGESS